MTAALHRPVWTAVLATQCLWVWMPAAAATPSSKAGAVIVEARPVTEQYTAYGEVRPVALLPVRAVEPGIVTGMREFPGSRVKAGQILAKLQGPEIESRLVDRNGALRSARSRLAAARRTLAIEQHQLTSQLSTRQAVAGAQSAVAAATAAFDTARAQLQVARGLSTLHAPSAGTVVAVNAADGERIAAGQTLLTLQAGGGLWLTASYYGRDARSIRHGMRGWFQPAASGAPIPVEVESVSATLGADGGESVGLVATDQPAGKRHAADPWLNGERGTVMLAGGTRSMIAVPTRAIILDQARWWVLVRTAKGIRRQSVVPGPTRGWQTFIERGLRPGQQVVVQNAYLEFQRGISQQYLPPD